MNRRWQFPILVALVVALGGYAGFVTVENRNLKERLAQAPLPVKPTSPAEALQSGAIGLPAADPGEAAVASGEGEATPEMTREQQEQRRSKERQQRLARMLSMFDNPDTRLDMIERSMGRLDARYADLFKKLKLPPEELEILKTLMAERFVLRSEGQMRAFAATPEERDAVREAAREKSQAVQEDIAALLGEEQMDVYKQYNNSLPYRSSVEDLSRSLSYTQSPLNERQSEYLVNTYAKVASQYEFTNDLSNLNRGELSMITASDLETYRAERAAFDAMILKQASAALNSAQLDALAQKQITDLNQQIRQTQFMIENGGGDRGRGGPGGYSGWGRGGF